MLNIATSFIRTTFKERFLQNYMENRNIFHENLSQWYLQLIWDLSVYALMRMCNAQYYTDVTFYNL